MYNLEIEFNGPKYGYDSSFVFVIETNYIPNIGDKITYTGFTKDKEILMVVVDKIIRFNYDEQKHLAPIKIEVVYV